MCGCTWVGRPACRARRLSRPRTWAAVMQHRFAGRGEMNGHVVGNLLIVGLWELMGKPVRALDWVGRLLGANGRVIPMATRSRSGSKGSRGRSTGCGTGASTTGGWWPAAT